MHEFRNEYRVFGAMLRIVTTEYQGVNSIINKSGLMFYCAKN